MMTDWIIGLPAEVVDVGFEMTASQLAGSVEAVPLMLSLVALGAVEVVGRQQL